MEARYIISFRFRPTAYSDNLELGRCGNGMCDIGVRWVSVFSERGGEGEMRRKGGEGERGDLGRGEREKVEKRIADFVGFVDALRLTTFGASCPF